MLKHILFKIKEYIDLKKNSSDLLQQQLTPQKGVSDIGIQTRRADPRIKGVEAHGYARVSSPEKHAIYAKESHKRLLEHLKGLQKLNLPKTEGALLEDMQKRAEQGPRIISEPMIQNAPFINTQPKMKTPPDMYSNNNPVKGKK